MLLKLDLRVILPKKLWHAPASPSRLALEYPKGALQCEARSSKRSGDKYPSHVGSRERWDFKLF